MLCLLLCFRTFKLVSCVIISNLLFFCCICISSVNAQAGRYDMNFTLLSACARMHLDPRELCAFTCIHVNANAVSCVRLRA